MGTLARQFAAPLTYTRIVYLLLALPLGTIEFSFLVTALSFGVGTAVTLIGIPVLIATVYAWRWLAEIERRLIGALTGVRIASPYTPAPADARWFKRLQVRLSDPATWKDLVFLMLQLPLGIASFTITVVVIGLALGLIGAPAYYWAIPEGIELGIGRADSLGEALALMPLGVVVAFVGIPGLGQLGRLYGRFASIMLGSNTDPKLAAQVTDLQSARSRIIAAADAERRRIERDLHDGAQQRLVALTLQLRMAEARAAAGDPQAAELIRGAGDEANQALKELRDLARGIHPAILTNRGLAAALDDLAARAPLPVEIVEAPDERLADQVEAAAYFVVSEALANVAKHAEAESATVTARVNDGRLLVEVGDDGRGGASLGTGSGLQGLEDRVGALNGTLELDSRPGEGTRLKACIPLEPEAAELVDEFVEEPGPRLLPDAEVDVTRARRLHHSRLAVSILGGLALLLVVLWFLTGRTGSPPWFVWPLLGLGLAAALIGWLAVTALPLRESDADPTRPRAAEIARLRRARSLRIDAGVLSAINLTLIGIWAAGGGGYFWPAWSILGCGAAFGLKAVASQRRFHIG